MYEGYFENTPASQRIKKEDFTTMKSDNNNDDIISLKCNLTLIVETY